MKPRIGYCVVCGKRCQPWELNADGTYLHTSCATGGAIWPQPKEEEEERP